MPTRTIDEAQLLALHAEGKTPAEIARLMDLPRSTVRERLKKRAQATDSPPIESTHLPLEKIRGGADHAPHALQELLAWWQERKVALQKSNDASRQTERCTFHVEKRWLAAIKRRADLDALTYTQIVNDAFRQYFERESGHRVNIASTRGHR
jgi:Homeodomain-like domain-containing protein